MQASINDYNIIARMSAVFILILMISGNYLGEILPCKVQTILSNNLLFKHIAGFFTLIFFVTLSIPELKEPNYILKYSAFIYLLFFITSKTYYIFWFAIFILIGFIYLLDIYEEYYNKNKKKNNDNLNKLNQEINSINQLKYILSYIVSFLTIIGFFTYLGLKKLEYGKDFSYYKFLFEMPSCVSRNVNNPGIFKLFLNAFK